MVTRILTFCLLALSCGIAQSQDAPPTIVDDSAEESVAIMNKLREIVVAIISFDSANGATPARYTKAPDGTPLLSWRVHILPFLEQDELYRKFRLEEPWNSPHNKKLIQEMPDIYKTPKLQESALSGRTHFVGIEHAQSVLPTPLQPGNTLGTDISRFTNGAANTIAVVFGAGDAAKDAVPWTQPVDLRIRIENPFDDLVANEEGVVHCAMLDGSLQSLTKEKYEQVKNLSFFTSRNPHLIERTVDTKSIYQDRLRDPLTLTNRDIAHGDSLRQNQSSWASPNPPRYATRRTEVRSADSFGGARYSDAVPPSSNQFGRDFQLTNRSYNSDRVRKTQSLRNEALTADDEKTREEKLSLLKETLEQSFEESIKAQETELEMLKARVAKLNAVFEKRKSNRDRVIENYIDRVRLQAEGLTIPQGNPAFSVRQSSSGFGQTSVSGSRVDTLVSPRPFSRNFNLPNVKQSGGR